MAHAIPLPDPDESRQPMLGIIVSQQPEPDWFRTGHARASDTDDLEPAMRAAVGFLAPYQPPTYDTYRHYLHQWLTWCQQEGLHPLRVERTHIELYIRWMTNRGLTPGTIGAAMTPVRGYYKLAAYDDLIRKDPCVYARLPKIQVHQEAPFDRDDMRHLLMAARDLSPRHYALVAMLSMMGMRASEACSIDVPQIYNVEQGYRILRYIGKGRKPAETPIPYQAIPILEACAEWPSPRRSGPLLTNRDGTTRLTRHGAAGLIDTAAKHAGFDKTVRSVHPHLLRKGAVTLLIDTADLVTAQDFARHESPNVTRKHYDLNRGHRVATHGVHTVGARLAI